MNVHGAYVEYLEYLPVVLSGMFMSISFFVLNPEERSMCHNALVSDKKESPPRNSMSTLSMSSVNSVLHQVELASAAAPWLDKPVMHADVHDDVSVVGNEDINYRNTDFVGEVPAFRDTYFMADEQNDFVVHRRFDADRPSFV
jgi:hypothetical protein